GFEGVDWLKFRKNSHVVLRDVGNSGFFPNSTPSQTQSQARSAVPGNGSVEVKARVASANGETGQKTTQGARASEPTPLDVRSDGPMRIDVPKPAVPIRVGPPEPPAPTRVQFDRNVVAFHGKLDRRPAQLNCDTLQLLLVPAEKPVPQR